MIMAFDRRVPRKTFDAKTEGAEILISPLAKPRKNAETLWEN
jgi:hypothetical protein